MNDLTTFRDHCRRMADSKPTDRIRATWAGGRDTQVAPVGVIPDAERDLWRRLAGEVDAYLASENADPTDTDLPFDFHAAHNQETR